MTVIVKKTMGFKGSIQKNGHQKQQLIIEDVTWINKMRKSLHKRRKTRKSNEIIMLNKSASNHSDTEV